MVVNYICISTSSFGGFSKNSNNFWARRKISRTSKNILRQHHFQYSLKLKFISITNKRNIFFHRGGWDGGGGESFHYFSFLLYFCWYHATPFHWNYRHSFLYGTTVLIVLQYYSTNIGTNHWQPRSHVISSWGTFPCILILT